MLYKKWYVSDKTEHWLVPQNNTNASDPVTVALISYSIPVKSSADMTIGI